MKEELSSEALEARRKYQREWKKEWRKANLERQREYERNWRAANSDKVAAIQRRYWEKKAREISEAKQGTDTGENNQGKR